MKNELKELIQKYEAGELSERYGYKLASFWGFAIIEFLHDDEWVFGYEKDGDKKTFFLRKLYTDKHGQYFKYKGGKKYIDKFGSHEKYL